ncbi:MAG: Hint domain-containing protein [Paracoccaceae bacterium]
MGYNIAEISGNGTSSGGADGDWTFSADLSDPAVTTVTGDFDVEYLFGGNQGEATDGYSTSGLSDPSFGTLTLDTTTGEFTFTIDRDAVIASGSDQSVTFTIVGTSGGNTDSDTVTIDILICVARGTLVDTPSGPRRVEDLRIGDAVHTVDHGPSPLRWIGSKAVQRDELARSPELRPIRISADALGMGIPRRDLVVSPQHRILLDDWRAELFFGEAELLVPAKALINDSTITVDHSLNPVEYFHLLFDQHEIVLTEGARTESFHPGPQGLATLDSAARRELVRLFPDLGGKRPAFLPAARTSLSVREGALFAVVPDTNAA